MATIEEIRAGIKEARKNGVSYRMIAEGLYITPPSVQRIEQGKKIGGKTIRALKLDPSEKLQATRERREKLNKIAAYWKYESWSNYETVVLKDFDKNYNFETGEWRDG